MYIYNVYFSPQQHGQRASPPHVDGTEENCLPRRLALRFHQFYRDRPNRDYSLLVATSSGPNQLGLVAKNVKEYIWACRYLGQCSGPDTEWRRGI
jgi:hypothetical protein